MPGRHHADRQSAATCLDYRPSGYSRPPLACPLVRAPGRRKVLNQTVTYSLCPFGRAPNSGSGRTAGRFPLCRLLAPVPLPLPSRHTLQHYTVSEKLSEKSRTGSLGSPTGVRSDTFRSIFTSVYPPNLRSEHRSTPFWTVSEGVFSEVHWLYACLEFGSTTSEITKAKHTT